MRPPWAGAVFVEQLLGLGQAAIGGLDHALGQQAQDRLGLVEAAGRQHHAQAGSGDRACRGVGMIVARIDEAGDAVPEQLDRRERGADVHVFLGHGSLVGIHVIEQKRLGIGFVGEPARHLKRGMQMVVDKTRRPDHALAVDHLVAAPGTLDVGGLAHGDELAAFHGHGRVAYDPALGVDGYQPVNVPYDQIGLLRCAHLLSPT